MRLGTHCIHLCKLQRTGEPQGSYGRWCNVKVQAGTSSFFPPCFQFSSNNTRRELIIASATSVLRYDTRWKLALTVWCGGGGFTQLVVMHGHSKNQHRGQAHHGCNCPNYLSRMLIAALGYLLLSHPLFHWEWVAYHPVSADDWPPVQIF